VEDGRRQPPARQHANDRRDDATESGQDRDDLGRDQPEHRHRVRLDDTHARLFRDRLKCDNALFLDGGSVPSLYAPELRRNGNLLPLGPMIAVYERGR